MLLKKKLILIFLVLVLLPIAASFINGYIGNLHPLSWSDDHRNQVTLWSLGVIIFGNVTVLFLNYSKGLNSILLYVISSLLLVISAFLLYALNMLQNFGF